MRLLLPAVALVVASLLNPSYAADLSSTFVTKGPAYRSHNIPQSIMVFGGALSTTDMGKTAYFNLSEPASARSYDNQIVGLAYRRDIKTLNYGFSLAGEIGIADRFGRYASCCTPEVITGTRHSAEVWTGPTLRHDGAVLGAFRVAGSVTAGLSATSNSIGREREREVSLNGNARVLFYLAPEVTFALTSAPEWELLLRLHHRSGAGGTLGKLQEGYNANVVGIRRHY